LGGIALLCNEVTRAVESKISDPALCSLGKVDHFADVNEMMFNPKLLDIFISHKGTKTQSIEYTYFTQRRKGAK